MLTKSHVRRVVAPTVLTGLLTASALAAATPASALEISPRALSAMAPAAAAISSPAGDLVERSTAGQQTAAAPPQVTVAQSVVPGVKFRAKPPPWVLPVEGYHLTGRFGDSSGLWSGTHTGLDFAAAEGTEIRSIGPGVVLSTAYDGSFGNKTVEKLDDGTVLWYCHQSAFGVKPGQRLAPGELLGYIGSTGNVTGPHLHLEVHPGGGDAIDPEVWLPRHGLHP